MKIRLIGTAAELRAEVQRLDAHYGAGAGAVSVSSPYPCRREPAGTFRVYVEVATTGPITVSATSDRNREGLPALPPGDLGHSELEHSP